MGHKAEARHYNEENIQMEGETQCSWRTTEIWEGLLRNTLTGSHASNSQASYAIIFGQTLAIKTSEFFNGITTGTNQIRHVHAPSTRNYNKARE